MISILLLFGLFWLLSELSGFSILEFISNSKNLFKSSDAESADAAGDESFSINTLEDEINKFSILLYNNIPNENLNTLLRRSKILIVNDGYGGMETTGWVKELAKYVKNHAINDRCQSDFCRLKVYSGFYRIDGRRITDEKLIFVIAERLCLMILNNGNTHFDSSNSMSGCDVRPNDPIEYELFCADILRSTGWQVSPTKTSGDQGADLIAIKSKRVLLIQCKLYTKPVGNKAVQEVVSALKYYGGNEGAVVTNSEFTTSAKRLANANCIKLIHDSELFRI